MENNDENKLKQWLSEIANGDYDDVYNHKNRIQPCEGTRAERSRKRHKETASSESSKTVTFRDDDDEYEDDDREFQAAVQRTTDRNRLRHEEERKYRKLQRAEEELLQVQHFTDTGTQIDDDDSEPELEPGPGAGLGNPVAQAEEKNNKEQELTSTGTQIDASDCGSTDGQTDPEAQSAERKPDGDVAIIKINDVSKDKEKEEEETKTACECCGFRLPNTTLDQPDFHYPCNESCGNLWYCPLSKQSHSYRTSDVQPAASVVYPCGCVS